MKKALIILIALMTNLAIYSKDLESIKFNSETIDYYLFNNDEINTNDPLLIVLGDQKSSYKKIDQLGFLDLAKQESFMICYPFEIPNEDPSGFIKDLIKELCEEYKLDRRRVYLTSLLGTSEYFNEIISFASKEIAAFTVFNEDLLTSKLMEENWSPSSVLVLQDKVSPVDKILEIEELVELNNTLDKAVRVDRHNIIDGKVYDHFIFNGGINHTSVEVLLLDEVAINSSLAYELWGFLSAYKLGGLVIPNDGDYVNNSISIYPDVSYSNISIDFQSNDTKKVKFISPEGEKLIDEAVAVYHYNIKLSEYPNGVYYLEIDDEVYKVVKSQ